MRAARVALLALGPLACGCAAAEEWLGLGDVNPGYLGLEINVEDSGDLAAAAGFALPLGPTSGFEGNYGVTEFSDGEDEFDNLLLASRVWLELTTMLDLELMHWFEGNDDELEKETLGIGFNLRQGEWYLRVHYEDGDLLIFTRDDLFDFLPNRLPDRLETDVSAYGLRFGWQGVDWYWEAARQRYDYADDLSALGQSAFAQFIVKSSALAHSSLLVSEYTALLVGRSDQDNDYSILLWHDRAAIDDLTSDSMTLSWQHWAGANFGYLLAISLPGDDEVVGLTLGLRWVI